MWDHAETRVRTLVKTIMFVAWLTTRSARSGALTVVTSIVLATQALGLAATSDAGKFEAQTWELEHVRTLKGHNNPCPSLRFSDDGKLLSGSWDGSVRLWDAESGVEQYALKTQYSIGAVRFAGDGSVLAVTRGGKVIHADSHLNITSTVQVDATAHANSISASKDGGVIVFNETMPIGVAIYRKLERTELFKGKRIDFSDLSEDGRQFFVLSEANLYRADSDSGSIAAQRQFADERIRSAAIDGEFALGLGSGEIVLLDDDLKDRWRAKGHDAEIMAICLSKRFVLTGGRDGLIRLWSRRNGELLATATLRAKAVFAVAVSPDENNVAVSFGRDPDDHTWKFLSREISAPGGNPLYLFRIVKRPVRR